MKKIQLSLLVLFCFTLAKAQLLDTAFSAVHYSFSYVGDTTKRSNTYEENMVLFLGKKSTVFESWDKLVQDSVLRSKYNTTGSFSAIPRSYIRVVMYNFLNEKKFVVNQNELTAYLMDDTIKINWTINNIVKEIGGIKCQNATCKFRGRLYNAWFAPSIPISSGPWKLGGLPGLILDAHDSKNEIVFRFAAIENIKEKQKIIKLPQRAVYTTIKEYNKIKEAILADPEAYINSTQAYKVKINVDSKPKSGKVKNPIELSENK